MRRAIVLPLAAVALAGCGTPKLDEGEVRSAYARIVRECRTPVARQSLTAADEALNDIIRQYGRHHDGRVALRDGQAPVPLREVLSRVAGVFLSKVPGPSYGEPRCSPDLADKIAKLLAKPRN